MRLPYIPDPLPPSASPSSQAIAARIRARRAPRPLTNLDRTLLHSPPVADGWNSFMGAIRTQTTSLAAAPRELAICRIAILNGADYEYGHHFPLLTDALPDTPKETLEAVLRLDAFVVPGEAELPDAKLRAVFRYTDAMTKSVAVPQEVFEGLQGLCEEREVVEVTAVVAAYNCVSRFLVALGVGDDETDK